MKRNMYSLAPGILLAVLVFGVFLARNLHNPVLPKRQSSQEIPSGQYRIDKVTDGDSLVIHYHGKRIRIRLTEIDCPEWNQPWGDKATEFSRATVEGKNVFLAPLGLDQYGRQLAQVTLDDGTQMNHLLVREGYAWVRRDYVKDMTLLDVEEKARHLSKGLWAQSDPESPWSFKRRQRKQGQ